jgi:hypothetical protein
VQTALFNVIREVSKSIPLNMRMEIDPFSEKFLHFFFFGRVGDGHKPQNTSGVFTGLQIGRPSGRRFESRLD